MRQRLQWTYSTMNWILAFTVVNSVKNGDKNDDIKIGGSSSKNKEKILTTEKKKQESQYQLLLDRFSFK